MENIIEERVRKNINELLKTEKREKNIFSIYYNKYVLYILEQLKINNTLEKELKKVSEDIKELEQYGIRKKKDDITGIGSTTKYYKNNSEYELIENQLNFLCSRREKIQNLYKISNEKCIDYKNSIGYEVWKMKELENMEKEQIKKTFKIMGAELSTPVRKIIDEFKKDILFDDPRFFKILDI